MRLKDNFICYAFARIGFCKKTEPYVTILIKSIGLSQTVFYKMERFVFPKQFFCGFGSVQLSISHMFEFLKEWNQNKPNHFIRTVQFSFFTPKVLY